ncbi:MAG: uroporphyrinogen decarboxylase family protein [Anaerolineae bacterium]
MNHFAHIPLLRAQPDCERFIATLMGRVQPEIPPMVEYLIDDTLRKPIVTNLLGEQWVEIKPGDRASLEGYLDNFISVWWQLGYDFVRFEQSLPFSEEHVQGNDATRSDGVRSWNDMHHGTITSWAEFEAFKWPEVTPTFFANYEYLSRHLPDGMGLIVSHGGGIYEHLAAIFSYEGLCYALYDQPELVAAVAERIGNLMLKIYEQLVQLEHVIAIFPGDDMGFRSATLLPPDALRSYILPWHTRYANLAHEAGLPYFLHSCGNLRQIMPDLIDTVGIDAKHSFENAIIPVDQFQAEYGKRIGVLGGVDIDILGRGTPEQVRAETRRLINVCAPRGRYAIGSGNSIPSYVPLENFLTMLDEAQR